MPWRGSFGRILTMQLEPPKKEHGKSNLHAEEDFLQKLESLNLDPRLKKLLITNEEVFPPCCPPSLVKNWSRWT